MSLFALAERIGFNCFFNCFGDPSNDKNSKNRRKNKVANPGNNNQNNNKFVESIHELGQQYNISVLPVHANFEIDNIYPETNQVDKWNIIIIGSDKTFVHVHLYDLQIPDAQLFLNHRSGAVLGKELKEFFDPVFDATLCGRQLQFLIGWSGDIYLVNTFPIRNPNSNVIGAILFIRNYLLLPRISFHGSVMDE
jgi:hypothetical protein